MDRIFGSAANAPASSLNAAQLTCGDREPGNMPGAIQPHGVVLGLDPGDLRITHAGGDTPGLLAASPQSLLGENASRIFSRKQVSWLRTLPNSGCTHRAVHPFSIANKPVGSGTSDMIACRGGGLLVIELDPRREQIRGHPLAVIQTMLRNIRQADTAVTFCQAVVDEIRHVIGFDRVVFYRFLADARSAVIAETSASNLDSFPGQEDSEFDIARQARELFPANRIHTIPDARHAPAPILSVRDARLANSLDISHSALRSVSSRHRQYLVNNGVVASVSMSIVIRGRLWGMIACHHSEPRYPTYGLREAYELFTEMVSSQLEARAAAEYREIEERSANVRQERLNRNCQESELGRSPGPAARQLPVRAGTSTGVELSSREIEVARLAAAGFSTKTIALKLRIGVKSVETYKARYMKKLGFRSRVELIHYAAGKGWLGAP